MVPAARRRRLSKISPHVDASAANGNVGVDWTPAMAGHQRLPDWRPHVSRCTTRSTISSLDTARRLSVLGMEGRAERLDASGIANIPSPVVAYPIGSSVRLNGSLIQVFSMASSGLETTSSYNLAETRHGCGGSVSMTGLPSYDNFVVKSPSSAPVSTVRRDARNSAASRIGGSTALSCKPSTCFRAGHSRRTVAPWSLSINAAAQLDPEGIESRVAAP